ncbi:MAG: MmgE/PrpD family protein, partial [Candidatus Binatia bacterium]
MSQSEHLANYVFGLKYGVIPQEVIQRAKDCLLDSIGAGLHGSTKPWGKIVGALVKERGGNGASSIFGD